MRDKRIIFHLPDYVNLDRPISGSQIRPCKLIDAFKNLGYCVDLVIGYGKERKKQIVKIKQNISEGVHYSFCYSESSTTPTLLTERSHLPIYPFMDFNFFKFLKKRGIKIGLFYRDVYWAFKDYSILNPIKRMITVFFYKYDLYNYNKYIDVIFLPSLNMNNFIPYSLNVKVEELPPGIEDCFYEREKCEIGKEIKLFYVGGIGGSLYNISNVFKALKKISYVKAVICVREEEWNKSLPQYLPLVSGNVDVVHKNGVELESIYRNVDIALLYTESIEYRTFAMPIKLFEYLSYQKPIIATKGTAVGDFVERHNIGWVIDYDESVFLNLLNYLKGNSEEIIKKKDNIVKISASMTWTAQIKKIISLLET